MKKIWDKGAELNPAVEKFTIGEDMKYDLMMATWDITATLAHARMLCNQGLITEIEFSSIAEVLASLFDSAEKGMLQVPLNAEDIHSVIEAELIHELGLTGKKIHTGRSRNDQVLTAVRLYLKEQMALVAGRVVQLTKILVEKADAGSAIMMPGYTHMQIAMLSTFGMWFGSFAEGLADDLLVMKSSWDVNNRNPLGTAAGYGSDLDIDRDLTTALLEFGGMNIISPYAQVSRGKVERIVASGISSIAATLSKMASDIILYSGQNFSFFSLPEGLTTGSSIMPQKKNPDIAELIRGKCNRIQSVPNEITILIANLPSGYHRDSQLLKEIIFPSFATLIECLEMAILLIRNIQINSDLMKNEIYNPLLSANEVNRLVREGVPFRDAYKKVSDQLGKVKFDTPDLGTFIHKGSAGNLCLNEIVERTGALGSYFTTKDARTLFEKIKDYRSS